MSKMLRSIKRILPTNIKTPYMFLYFGLLLFCFLFSQQGDLFHTSSSSYAYLNGHITDFYDYNKPLVDGNDYLPLMYIIFAIWNLPLKILGLTHDVETYGIWLNIPELIWTKLLLVVFYFASAYIMYKICRYITNDEDNSKIISIIFITSPIAIFAVFIFGQYDIISVFFTMLGYYYYVKNDYLKFSIFFSLAISIKFFPLLIFVPLLLLVEKRLLQILKYGIISVSATILQILMYLHNTAFRERIFSLASGKISSSAVYYLTSINNAPILTTVFIVLCIYTYFKNINSNDEKNKLSIYVSILSYAVMFSTVIWHPQWLIIIMPFFSFAYLYIRDVKKLVVVDIAGTLSYIYIVSNFWPNHVDTAMVKNGVFRYLIPYIPLTMNKLFVPRFTSMFMGAFFIYLFSYLIILVIQKHNKHIPERINYNTLINSRLYIGMAVILIPMLFCTFAPKSIARKFDPLAYTVQGLSITQSEKPAGLINSNTSVKQSFIAEESKLSGIKILIATYARVNNCEVTLELFDQDNNLIASQKADGSKLEDNSYFSFMFDPINDSKGKTYYLKIKSDGTEENSITAWMSNEDAYADGKFYINDQESTGDLCFTLYYDY